MVSSLADFQPADFGLPPFKEWTPIHPFSDWFSSQYDVEKLCCKNMKASENYLTINLVQYGGLENNWEKQWQDNSRVQVTTLLTWIRCKYIGEPQNTMLTPKTMHKCWQYLEIASHLNCSPPDFGLWDILKPKARRILRQVLEISYF